MLEWMDEAADSDDPFFFWYASVIPHVACIPADQIEKHGYEKSMDTKPYFGDKGYTPHPRPNAAYASMITYLDEQVGRVKLLEEKGELDNTLIIFSSDNGTTYVGGVDRTTSIHCRTCAATKAMSLKAGSVCR